jgi:hypothetical protein
LAIYIPITIERICSVYQVAVENGATLNGSFDIAIFDWPSYTKLVGTGAVSQTGSGAIQTVDITDTVLRPGNYFVGMSTNSGTATYRGTIALSARALRSVGVQQQSSAYTLPDPMVPAAMAQAWVPWVSLSMVETI